MRNENRGFTLIELLIVIAIIGILAVVMIPRLMSARNAAINRAAQAYTQNISKAAFAYVAEDTARDVITSADCKSGYTAGTYAANSAGASIATCTVSDADSDKVPEIVVTSSLGIEFTSP